MENLRRYSLLEPERPPSFPPDEVRMSEFPPDPNFCIQVSERLRAFREQHKISKTQASKFFGIGANIILQIESGAASPMANRRIEKALNKCESEGVVPCYTCLHCRKKSPTANHDERPTCCRASMRDLQ